MAANSSGASVFAAHPTIAGLYLGVTDSTSTIGIDPIVLCLFRNVSPDTTANTYHHGCIAIVVSDTTGVNSVYQNTGTYSSPSWTLFDTGTGFAIPTVATDAATTTGTSFALTMSAITTGVAESLTAAGVTTGTIFKAVAAAATLTTGFYFAANDGALNVFTVGANGHITSNQTTAPTVASTVAQGITAAAITAGSTDTCGQITTTGTQNNTADSTITVTFNKTYTVAPKAVLLEPGNNAASNPLAPYVSSITATTFVVGFPKTATAQATPSLYYVVIA
jgi:hypothetical protein